MPPPPPLILCLRSHCHIAYARQFDMLRLPYHDICQAMLTFTLLCLIAAAMPLLMLLRLLFIIRYMALMLLRRRCFFVTPCRYFCRYYAVIICRRAIT